MRKSNVSAPRSNGSWNGAATSLRAEIDGRTFAPFTWATHGTRIVLISPPDFLTAAQVRAIHRAMSH